MAEKFLDYLDVCAPFVQVGGVAVSQAVKCNGLSNS